MPYNDYFSFKRLTTSGLHPQIDNLPPNDLIENGSRLSWKLDQARAIWSKKLGRECNVRITYGYRCPKLNTACGSTSTTSAHLEFSAADCIPEGLTLRQAWDALREDPEFMKDVDQLIIERGCVHIGLPVKAHDFIPRHELRMDVTVKGVRKYPLWAVWPEEGV